ncbi:MAG TPA: TonB-dependent receptor [Gemmatimonadaceae bacterium]|nr:TonB-dependent receptor [Gemmatimonadaceae bacterium]
MTLHRIAFLAAAAVVATPALLTAQARDTARVAPVVTTATRTPLDPQQVPASVTVITGEQLRALGITTVADALAATPSVAIAQSGSMGGITSLFMRGGESKYVKVLVDGVPVNDPGGAIDLGSFTTDNIERIEVVRGPASVLYGADAVSGVVQIFTRDGRGPLRATVQARGGTYHTGDGEVTLAGGSPAASYSLSASRHQTDGIYPFNNQFAESVVSARTVLAPDSADALQLALRYTDSRYHYPTNSAGNVVDHNAFTSGDRTVLGAQYTHTFSPAIALVVNAASNETSGGTNDQPDSTGGDLYVSLDGVRTRSVDARVNIRDAMDRAMLTLGASMEAEDQASQSQGTFGGYPYSSTFTAFRRNRAGYAQALWRDPSGVTLVAGARVDDNQQFGTFGTYRVGVNYLAATGTRLRAAVGTAFREPTFFENYSTGYVTGNPSLRPERAASWEAAVEQQLLDDRVTVGVTAFSQDFRDMIDYTSGMSACGYSYCNVARARAAGEEYEATARLASWASASAGFTHLDTRVLTPGFDTTSAGLYHAGQSLIRRPRASWNAALAAQAAGRGSLDVRFTYVGERADRDFRPYPAVPVTLPSYLRVDLGGSLDISHAADGTGTALTLRIENLTDRHYQSVFNFLAPGRTVLAGLRATM